LGAVSEPGFGLAVALAIVGLGAAADDAAGALVGLAALATALAAAGPGVTTGVLGEEGTPVDLGGLLAAEVAIVARGALAVGAGSGAAALAAADGDETGAGVGNAAGTAGADAESEDATAPAGGSADGAAALAWW